MTIDINDAISSSKIHLQTQKQAVVRWMVLDIGRARNPRVTKWGAKEWGAFRERSISSTS
jgi:hypothetical protein